MIDDSIPVPRNRIFALADGTFVVQWEEHRVQGLLDGRYYPYDARQHHDLEHITDFELSQLQKVGVVERYDHELVYLSPRPSPTPQHPPRTYYLHTTRPKNHRAEIETTLERIGLTEQFSVRVQETYVIIRGKDGAGYLTFDAAEKARSTLESAAPEVFKETVVAFIEIIPIE